MVSGATCEFVLMHSDQAANSHAALGVPAKKVLGALFRQRSHLLFVLSRVVQIVQLRVAVHTYNAKTWEAEAE